MTPFEELASTGTLGPATYELLITMTCKVARRYNFPPPSGFEAWNEGTATDWLSEEFFPRKGFELLVRLQLQAVDQASLERQLWTTIHNVLRDVAKKTTEAKLASRLSGILQKDARFLDATKIYAGEKAWTLPALGSEVFTGDWEELLYDPRLKKLPNLETLNTNGPTSSRNVATLSAAALILIDRAAGALEQIVIAKALVRLFDLGDGEQLGLRETDEGDESKVGVPGELMLQLETADRAWNSLTDHEQLVFGLSDRPLVEIQTVLPWVDDIQAVQGNLARKLDDVFGYGPEVEEARAIVLARCRDRVANL